MVDADDTLKFLLQRIWLSRMPSEYSRKKFPSLTFFL